MTLNPHRGGGRGVTPAAPAPVGAGQPGIPTPLAAAPQGGEVIGGYEEGAEGRPVVRYNPFGADARVPEEMVAAEGSEAAKKLSGAAPTTGTVSAGKTPPPEVGP